MRLSFKKQMTVEFLKDYYPKRVIQEITKFSTENGVVNLVYSYFYQKNEKITKYDEQRVYASFLYGEKYIKLAQASLLKQRIKKI
jgi:hypothetical protein